MITKEEMEIMRDAVNIINNNRESWNPWFPSAFSLGEQLKQIADKADSMGIQCSLSPTFYCLLEQELEISY